MGSDQSLAEYKVIGGYSVTLYPNRIEIVQKILGAKLNLKNETIPIKAIAKFEIPLAKRPEIRTIDGARYVLNLHPWQAKDLRERLLELL